MKRKKTFNIGEVSRLFNILHKGAHRSLPVFSGLP